MEKHFYLGSANTCYGFKNCFDNICPNGFTYILKGGPGTGKSTFMRKIGEYFEKKGEEVEYFHCSSDIESLDGVRIVDRNVAIVDGTAPHVTEAKIPAVTEKIVDLGEFIGKEVKNHKMHIEQLLKKKKLCFDIAYDYLKSAGDLFQIEKKTSEKYDFDRELKGLLALFSPQKDEKTNVARTLFLSYVSRNGIEFLKDKNKFKRVITVPNLDYVNSTNLLKELSKMLTKFNLPHICFYSLLEEERIDSVYVPKSNCLIMSEFSSSTLKNFSQINNILKQAGRMVSKAKFYHKKVENFYVKSMNFDGLNNLFEKIKNEIEGYN